MSEKIFNSRIVHKHAVEADWLKAVNFIPKQGEIIVYDVDANHDYERIKIGDGATIVSSLPFVDDSAKQGVSALGTIVGAVNSRVDTISTLVGDTAVSEQISTAIAGKSDNGHTHNYAGSSSAGGAATSANKLNTNAGSSTQPVYFENGVPVKTTYTLGASVPSDAKFTDTVYTHPTHTAKNSGLYKVTVDGTGHVSAATAVGKSDITALGIPAQDTTYSAATTSAAGLMSAADKTKLEGIAAGANKTTVDSALSSTSTNPVQNKIVNEAISNLNALVGDTSVSEQIAASNMIYVGPTAPTDPNIKVWINTAEEGTGIVPVLPRISTITLNANAWTGTSEPYKQVVAINTVTSATKIDLQPTAQQIVSLQNAEISLMIENNGGTVTCYAIGNKPTVGYTMQVLLQEVAYV